MDLFSDLIAAVQSDMTVDSNSSFLDPTTIKLAINRGYRKAAGLHQWVELEDAQKTSTQLGVEYYDYPDKWLANSIWKLKVNGVDYGVPLVFKDYLYEQENNYPSGNTKIWANNTRKYFITPTPTANGNNNIEIWGITATDPLVNDSDTTIFSYSLPECNEAIVLEAISILKNKGQLIQPVMRGFVGGTQLLSIEAQNILNVAWRKVQETKSKNQKTQAYFDVPDFFRVRKAIKTTQNIGNF